MGGKALSFHPSPVSPCSAIVVTAARGHYSLEPPKYPRDTTPKWSNSRSETWCDFGTKARLYHSWPQDFPRDIREKGKPKEDRVASNLMGGVAQV